MLVEYIEDTISATIASSGVQENVIQLHINTLVYWCLCFFVSFTQLIVDWFNVRYYFHDCVGRCYAKCCGRCYAIDLWQMKSHCGRCCNHLIGWLADVIAKVADGIATSGDGRCYCPCGRWEGCIGWNDFNYGRCYCLCGRWNSHWVNCLFYFLEYFEFYWSTNTIYSRRAKRRWGHVILGYSGVTWKRWQS